MEKRENAVNQHFLLFIRLSYYVITRGGGQAASPILCPEHISETMLATVMKFNWWIDLIKAEWSAQEP